MATPELQKMQNDPNFILEVAVGPPLPTLVEQKHEDGVSVYKKYAGKTPKRFIMKKAHLAMDDWRIWDFETGKLVYNSHHPGKNPIGSVDVLGTANQSNKYGRNGEWESYCDVTGHQGYPNFSIRPKTFSRHGRQYIMDNQGHTVMNIAKESRLKTRSMRSNHAVCRGDGDETVYHITGDMMERTLQILNTKEEQIGFVQKSAVSLILNAAIGEGSELLIDIAPGVDCSTILMIMVGLKQVGMSVFKDCFNNWVTNPLQNAVVDAVVENTGEIGQMAVTMNNEAAKHADHVVDKGKGHTLPPGVMLPPGNQAHRTDYHGLGM